MQEIDSAQIQDLLDQRMFPLEEEIRQVVAEMRAIPEGEQELANAVKHRLRRLHRQAHETYIEFGFEHSYCLRGLTILYNNRHRIERKKLQQAVDELAPAVQDMKVASSLRLFLEGNLVRVGEVFHDFEAMELSGKGFRLSSLLGNPILLNFWSGGCRGARRRNQWLLEHCETLKTQLQVVSFYLGTDKARWKQLSLENHIYWYNISDLKGGHGAVKTRYDFQSIPTSFLIDADGVVLAKERENDFGIDLLNSIEALLNPKPV